MVHDREEQLIESLKCSLAYDGFAVLEHDTQSGMQLEQIFSEVTHGFYVPILHPITLERVIFAFKPGLYGAYGRLYLFFSREFEAAKAVRSISFFQRNYARNIPFKEVIVVLKEAPKLGAASRITRYGARILNFDVIADQTHPKGRFRALDIDGTEITEWLRCWIYPPSIDTFNTAQQACRSGPSVGWFITMLNIAFSLLLTPSMVGSNYNLLILYSHITKSGIGYARLFSLLRSVISKLHLDMDIPGHIKEVLGKMVSPLSEMKLNAKLIRIIEEWFK